MTRPAKDRQLNFSMNYIITIKKTHPGTPRRALVLRIAATSVF
jgi:hypothetical protein